MLRQIILASTVTLAAAFAQAADPLAIKVYNADANSFHVPGRLPIAPMCGFLRSAPLQAHWAFLEISMCGPPIHRPKANVRHG